MKPTAFPQQTTTWAKNQPPYLPLPAYTDERETITCWRLSLWERLHLLFGGRLWLRQLNFGTALQPQRPAVRSPFLAEKDKGKPEAEGIAAAMDRPGIVCFCGSSRFAAEMAVLMWNCEKLGKIAVGLHLLPNNYPGIQPDHQAEAEGIAAAMDELHLRKIDLADEVFVVNVGGYIGDSTRREIAYTEAQGKPVRYLEPGGETSDG